MINLSISESIKERCPLLRLGCVSGTIKNEKHNSGLWQIINELTQQKQSMQIEEIKQIQAIHSSREGYKALGKEPSRYRLSAEALHRRVIQGKGLYQISNAVDIINLLSLKTGYSIGGYDLDKIQGDVKLGFGLKDEDYEAIGRGKMNIENLPVFKDSVGSFGSPTSDSIRTMISEKTQQILLVFLDFGKQQDLPAAMDETEDLLKRFAFGQNIQKQIIE